MIRSINVKRFSLLIVVLSLAVSMALSIVIVAENNDHISDVCGATRSEISYVLNSDGTYAVSGYHGFATEIIIPTVHEGRLVTSIGSYAFYDCTSLTSITIPNSVTSIGSYAFKYCSSLTSVTIPNSVTSIGDDAFASCSSLTSITIGNSVTSIGYAAFNGCCKLVEVYNLSSINIEKGSYDNGYVGYYAKDVYTSLNTPSKLSTDSNGYIIYTDGEEKILVGYVGNETALTLPSDITSINDYAFAYCFSLTSVTIGNSVTSIGSYAFSGCSSLTNITIPNSVTSIGSAAFYGCAYLTSITIPNSVTSIVYDVFNSSPIEYASIPTSAISYIPKGNLKEVVITSGDSIGERAFYDCDSLTSITIGNSVTSIGDWAFYGCDSLTSVTIPNSVTSIAYAAFAGCDSLTSITIPDSVTSIGFAAFYDCDSLTSVTFEDTTDWYSTYVYDNWQNKTGGTLVDVTNPTNNDELFVDNYYYHYWYKK